MSKLRFFVYPAVAALALAAAMVAHAQSAAADPSLPKTREQVKAELAQAIADGSIASSYGDYYRAPVPSPSTRTRAEVKAELAQARADGSLQASGDFYMPATAVTSTKTRAEVRAELLAWRAEHHDFGFEGDGADWYYHAARTSAPKTDASHVVAGAPAAASAQ